MTAVDGAIALIQQAWLNYHPRHVGIAMNIEPLHVRNGCKDPDVLAAAERAHFETVAAMECVKACAAELAKHENALRELIKTQAWLDSVGFARDPQFYIAAKADRRFPRAVRAAEHALRFLEAMR